MKKNKIVNTFIFFFLALTILSTNALFAAAENAKNPQIITNEYGKYIFAIWAKNDSTNDIIQTSYSSDYGSTWSSPIDLSFLGQNAAIPDLASDSYQKFIYGLWQRSNGTNIIVQFAYSKTNDFQNWSTAVDLSLAGQNATSPKIITSDIGKNVFVTWTRSNGTNDIIRFNRSTDFGSTWTGPIDLSGNGQNATMPQISSNENQNCICSLWTRSNGTNDIIQFRLSSNYGGTWASVINLSDAGQNAKDPQIQTTKNVIYAVWARSNGSNDIIQLRLSDSSGSNWSSAFDLSTTGQTAKNPQIAADKDGQNTYVAWARSNGTNDIIQLSYSSDYGLIWSSPIDLSATGQTAKDPQIATDNYGQNIYVTWIRSSGTNDIVQVAYSTDFGSTWSSPVDLSDAGQNAQDPQITTDADGQKACVIWTRSDGTKDVIQVSGSQFYGSLWSIPQTISD
ncbi:MAG: hypothetical protein KR126chlam6_00108 [Candidatus Anoxychlamydiales bacterium]|nr:hypothetical protein [Candidatus Anoxychlamydiales bacterium]